MPVVITGSNTPTAGGVTYGDGTTYATTAAGTSGQLLQSNGASAPSWVAAPSATAASQAEMETASSNTVFATPLNTKWNPGVAKVWIKCDPNGNIQGSLNVTSITDVAVGTVTVTIDTDFSSANYSVVPGAVWNGGNPVFVCIANNPSAGAFTIYAWMSFIAQVDPNYYTVACYGDQ